MRHVLLLALVSCAALAQVPGKLGYQGRLLTASGAPVTGIQAVTFRLFSAATGGGALWAETQSLGFSDGYFATHLGDASPVGCDGGACTGVPQTLFDGSELFLEVVIAGTPLTPRQRIASVAYALKAGEAYSVHGGVVEVADIIVTNSITTADGGIISAPPVCTGSGASLQFDGTNWLCSSVPPPPSTAGTLAYGQHTDAQCTGLSGTVQPDGAGNNFCKFSTGTCPSGWFPYLNYGTTTAKTCPATSTCCVTTIVFGGPVCTSTSTGTACTTGSHSSFANTPAETCVKKASTCPQPTNATCMATYTTRGCY